VVYEGYLNRLTQAGGLALIAWPGGPWEDDFLDLAQGALLVGGGDVEPARFGSSARGDATDPARDIFEFSLVRKIRDRGIPLLGLCRGAQAMNVALGGSLKEAAGHRQESPLATPSHPISVEPGSRLAGLLPGKGVEVNSFHRWAVDRPGGGLAPTARSPDGAVEAIESTSDWWGVGVQWHAELLDGDRGDQLFRGLIAATRGGAA
jgi:putative glutamine amidotransferase